MTITFEYLTEPKITEVKPTSITLPSIGHDTEPLGDFSAIDYTEIGVTSDMLWTPPTLTLESF